MFVWVMEYGMYSSAGVDGVYDSPETAMASNPVTDAQRSRYPKAAWREHPDSQGHSSYTNGCDWEDHLRLTRFEIVCAEQRAMLPPPDIGSDVPGGGAV